MSRVVDRSLRHQLWNADCDEAASAFAGESLEVDLGAGGFSLAGHGLGRVAAQMKRL
jgi:hypothetical protein